MRNVPIRHGHASPSRTYNSWRGMLDRCSNPSNRAYPRYGGRGITVCERWRNFANFLADMGERPPGKTLDRKNNDCGYTPENCRWATWMEQCQNRCARRRETYARGELAGPSKLTVANVKTILRGGKCDADFAKQFGVNDGTVRAIRLRETWRHVPSNRTKLYTRKIVHGESVHTAKLTESQVKKIRTSTGTIAEIAQKYGVTDVAISCIKRRKTWKHVP